MIPTQHSLVARMRAGVSNIDWQRFYALYEQPILAFAAARSLNQADCHDVLQETMVKMLRVGFARFDPEKGRFTTFLFHVARCCVIDAIRRRNRSESLHVSLHANPADHSSPGLLIELSDSADTPADAAEHRGQMALVLIALDFLIERKCFQAKTVELFKAATFQQKDPQEIARTFGTSTGNVYQAKHAVLARLQSLLEGMDRGLDLEEAFVRHPPA